MLPFVSEQESILQEVLSAYDFPATLVGAVFFREALTFWSVGGVVLIILSIAAVEFLPAGRRKRDALEVQDG